MRPYIKDGTPVGNESLCRTCCNAHIMTGYRESEKITICTNVGPNVVVPFIINNCTSYYDKNRPSWKQMEDLAIDVSTASMKPVGFKVNAGFLADTQVVEDEGVQEVEEEEPVAMKNTRGRLL